MAVVGRYAFPNLITTRGMCTVITCGICGASIVQVPGDAIDRQEQHADWHAERDELTRD